MHRNIPILIVAIAIIGIGIFYISRPQTSPNNQIISSSPSIAPSSSPSPSAAPQIIEPVAHFQQRITKKFFGTYVTPQHSPIQPERFTGYHTGVDAEYQDITTDVPVYAVADGTVLLARTASGYGGVIAIQHTINGKQVVGIYGHIRPSSLPKVGLRVLQGQQIGLLGTGYSKETDGERRHLHFGLVLGTTPTLTGYVANKKDLSTWIDPLTLSFTPQT